jgi:hypothetical protein
MMPAAAWQGATASASPLRRAADGKPAPTAHAMADARFESDRTFNQYQETQIQSVTLVPGTWYVRVLGDYAGRVSGSVHDAANETSPVPIVTQVRRLRGGSSARNRCARVDGFAPTAAAPLTIVPLPPCLTARVGLLSGSAGVSARGQQHHAGWSRQQSDAQAAGGAGPSKVFGRRGARPGPARKSPA